MNDSEILELVRASFYGLLALIGGLVSYLSTTGEPYSFKGCLIKALSSGFAGFLVGLLCIYFEVPSSIAYCISGTSGYLGAEATIAILKKYLIKHIPR